MSALLRRLRRRVMDARTRERRAYWLRAYLRAKAKAGTWDDRMLIGPDGRRHTCPNLATRAFIRRGVAAGLIVTSTNDGGHSATSMHDDDRAADLGNRRPGTAMARARMARFQRAEYQRALRGQTHPVELLGPVNDRCILRGRPATLGEGAALEDMHDTHVHGGF